MDFDVKNLLEAYPDLVDKVKELISSDEDWEFLLDVKHINDGLGSSTNYQYNPESKSFQLEMKNLVPTVAALLQV